MLLLQMVMVLTGILMVVAPRACTKKELRGDATTEAKTRTIGKWILVAGIIWVVTAMLF